MHGNDTRNPKGPKCSSGTWIMHCLQKMLLKSSTQTVDAARCAC
jgi:hypothetical protein